MNSSEFRAESRRKLTGKWGKAACISLAYAFIFFIIACVENIFSELCGIQSLLSLIVFVIQMPLSFGLIFSFLKLFKDEDISSFNFLSLGFSNFGKAWGVTFQIFLKMIIPFILIIVSYILIAFGIFSATASSILYNSVSIFSFIGLAGCVLLIFSMIWTVTKSYYYQLAYLIAAENLDITAKESVLKSEELMQGNRSKLFFLQLSFIGWAFLACFTFGIAYLWLLPYMQFSIVAFYKFVSGNNSDVEAEVIEDNSDNSNNSIK